MDSSGDNIKVLVRVRPNNQREINEGVCYIFHILIFIYWFLLLFRPNLVSSLIL
jgi:hypothetical protein